ncbi:DUF3578 domain-containing protein [uncultured Clostridium sp.]|uniref:MrcB family domain-containing protein n=1 Tax=uncultured Clostridium sp. TaxID=59620 RepID=UPI0025D55C97|nr:DUF3578 domain-containing protein [uncultured Clostridium sp.]
MNGLITEILYNYLKVKTETFKKNPMGQVLRNNLPSKIEKLLSLNKNTYTVTGSIGQGQWAEIPWISIFLNSITSTATNGYYIVYLFKSDMTGFYLSLNQGWTYFKNKYGTKDGRKKIEETSRIIRNKLSPLPDRFNLSKINLLASGTLGKGYELGHICGCYYDALNIPTTEKLIDDLRELLKEYTKIEKLIANRTTDEFNDFILLNSDNMFLDTTEEDSKFTLQAHEIISTDFTDAKLTHKEIIDKPINAPNPILKSNGSKTWPRSASIAANSLIHSNYKCSFDSTHPSFTSNKTKQTYMEPHHLIPLYEQSNFNVSLDVEANIVSLCSNCHNCIHYGVTKEKLIILKKLFLDRKDRLLQCGIDITFNQLLNMYKINENNLI